MSEAVTREIIRGKLLAAVDEMGVVLARASMSPVIYEVLDFATGICDATGELVAQNNGITLFTGTFATQVRAVLGRHGDSIADGDVFITNDPYEGGTHSADMALIKPVFVHGRLVAFAIAVAHWSEVGGSVPGSLAPDASEVFQEGLRLPLVRLYRRGERQEDLVRLITENVRLPGHSLCDLEAELAAVRLGESRLLEMAGRYGIERVLATFAGILEASEAQGRAAVSDLPDGVYTAEDQIDGDGSVDEPIPIRVVVTIAGDRMTCDFSGCAPQRRGPVNCARGALLSAVKTVFKALVDPSAPSNEGWFRPVEVVIPDGTVFSAVKPAPTGWYYEGTAHASELVWKALAPLAPDRLGAGSYLSLCAHYLCGTDPATGETFVHIEPQVGGWGAHPSGDGESGLIATTDGDTYNHSVELLEARLPLRIRRYALNTAEAAGHGERRGGLGVIRDYEMLAEDGVVYASVGRSRVRPWGLAGGGEGGVNRVELVQGSGVREAARLRLTPLRRGERMVVVTGAGGGWGDPRSRAPELVDADLADGLIDAATARRVYGRG
ncbi:MAG: hydantoinase B/oxoprolinase family protein [Geminicoccaceae bacterium]